MSRTIKSLVPCDKCLMFFFSKGQVLSIPKCFSFRILGSLKIKFRVSLVILEKKSPNNEFLKNLFHQINLNNINITDKYIFT
jgi:hypothetical protein